MYLLPYLPFVLLTLTRAYASDRCQRSDQYPSACQNGGYFSYNNPGSGNNDGERGYAFACPSMTMLSPPMISASVADGNQETFVYATAGGSRDDQCGMCYQVQLLDAERKWRDDFPLLIVQVINSGYDVLENQLDIFMGAGGFGYFTACNSDCTQRSCQGGACRKGMYKGVFSDWIDAQYDDPNLCYSGGIKWLDEKSPEELEDLCAQLNKGDVSKPFSQMTQQSCVQTNLQLFHQNFVASRSQRVQCPPGLVAVTKLQRPDDIDVPDLPRFDLPLTMQCRGDRSQGRFCVTTMQDCCKPSCAWSNKVPGLPVEGKECVASCDENGMEI